MIRYRWITNPVTVFIFSLVAIGTSLWLYIHSYLRVNEAFDEFVRKRNLDPSPLLETETWVMILIVSILVALIVVGVVVIFIYYQKMIQLYRMQQNFINGFTHELKTPIASLRLFLDTFSRHKLDEASQKKYLNYMIRDTERLSDNVNQILNLARIEDKKYEPVWETGNLKKFIQQWLDKTSYWSEDADVFLVDGEEGDFLVKYDVNLIPLVFMNLVNNALIHNDSERPKIEISLRNQEKAILVSFKDNGIGITKAEEKNVFRKFYQVRKAGKGSGIGLYLVQTVMKFHKGQVKLYSEGMGLGTTFILSFPIASLEDR
ncbi:MAG: HAMP domain-containing histidine kinase [Bacteriovoracaceae bacterium]|nr:HAMP domain-containing histidine kinase [Bacteriovoracaceae bacterium]